MQITYALKFHSEYTTFDLEWSDLAYTFRMEAIKHRAPQHKDYTECFGPFILKPNCNSRSIENIAGMSDCAVFDLDAKGWDVTRVKAALNGHTYMAHTTTNSRLEHPRWRIIVRLDREYSCAEHLSVWTYFHKLFGEQLDTSTKDASRIFFFPANWKHAYNVFLENDGDTYSVDEILKEYPPAPVKKTTTLSLTPKTQIVEADDVNIIEQWMVDKYLLGKTGGQTGRLFYLLCSAAGRADRRGFAVTPEQLADAAISAHPSISIDSKGVKRTKKSIVHEANNAIAHVSRAPRHEKQYAKRMASKEAAKVEIDSTLDYFEKIMAEANAPTAGSASHA